MKKLLLLSILILTIISISGCATGNDNTNPDSQQVIGGQKDANGCLTGAGYSWCKSMNKCVRAWEEYCPDLAPDTLARLKSATGIEFSTPAAGEFIWKTRLATGIKDNTIKGFFMTATNLKDEQFKSIQDFMLGDEFKTAKYNVAAGTTSGYDGYEKANLGISCIVNHTVADKDKDAKTNVKVSCGIFTKQ